jgi:hypothetical protein
MKFLSTTWAKKYLPFLGMILFFNVAFSQSDLTSPYSIFGPGIVNQRQSVSQFSMGGTGVALIDPYKMNLINPAATAYYMEPIFETAGRGNISTFETNVDQFDNRSFEINNLSLSFPIKRGKWALNIGLVPFTSVGYDVFVFEESEEAGLYLANYFGDGGISQGYFGTGINVYHKVDTANNVTALALGGQLNYNFGTITNSRSLSYLEDFDALGFEDSESILIRDVTFEIGVHGQTNIKKKSLSNPSYIKLLFGAVYTFGNDVNAEQNRYANSFRLFPNGASAAQDTIISAVRQKGTIYLPSSYTLGGALDFVNRKRMRLRWAFDYSVRNWQDYDVDFQGGTLEADFNRSQQIGTGLEWTPRLASSNYIETIEYRLGFRYVQTNLNLRNRDIEDVGMSFGMTLPLHFRRGLTKSSFHMGAEYGEYGTMQDGLIQETYIRIMAGFSFTPHFRNRWFVQPKYD